MVDDSRLNGLDDTPVYTIKTVVQETGIAPATLRAWERRYGVLSPGRSDGGYRLYSDRDISTLRWLKGHVDSGVSISRAVALLEIRHQAGREILTQVSRRQTVDPPGSVRTPENIADDLLNTLLAFQDAQSEALLSEAFALYPIETVAEKIITPILVEIGDRWHRNEASVVQEHFATAFLRRRLTVLLDAYEPSQPGPLAITGSASTEWHDVGILLVSLALRRAGWRVIYLAQNVPVEHLIQEIVKLRPALVCMSCAMEESALAIKGIPAALQALSSPRPKLVLGGRAFSVRPELAKLFPEAEIIPTPQALLLHLNRN